MPVQLKFENLCVGASCEMICLVRMGTQKQEKSCGPSREAGGGVTCLLSFDSSIQSNWWPGNSETGTSRLSISFPFCYLFKPLPH